MKQHVELTIFGKVQGVGFRYQAKRLADTLGIKGYARNMQDGSVTIVGEAESMLLDEFIAELKDSPGTSHVDKIDVNQSSLEGYREFTVY